MTSVFSTPAPAASPADGGDDAGLAARVSALDLESKVRLLTGGTLWTLPAEPRLGLLPVRMSDGPQGVRGTGDDPGATGLLAPAPSTLAASWDPELAERLGALFGAEAVRKRVDVLLAPGINLQRTPVAGRHFEYLSEDPLLTGILAAGLVRGIQSLGVAACPKHFVANESETDRTRYRSRVDPRTLREVYLAPFETVVAEGGTWSVMSAYSGVDDGTESAPMGEHAGLLRGVLKGEWGFDGAVVSDWAATRTTGESARGGLDLVMPGPDGPWGDALVAAVRAGEVPESMVDDKVVRLVRLAGRVGRLDSSPARPAVPARPDTAEYDLLRETAVRGTVVLRNEAGLLPLAPAGLARVALIGPNAVAPYFQGGGSAYVPPVRLVGFAKGLRAALPPSTEVTVHRGGDARLHPPFADPAMLADPETGGAGVRAEFLGADGAVLGSVVRETGDWGEFRAFPAGTRRVVLRTDVTLTGEGTHELEFGAVGRFEILADGERVAAGDDDRGVDLVLDSSHHHPEGITVGFPVADAEVPRRVALTLDLTVVDADGYGHFVTAHLRHTAPGTGTAEEIEAAVEAARAADVAVVVVGTNEDVESEGWDRTTLALPGAQDELVRRVAEANPRTVVVVNAGAPVLLPWAEDVPALLWAWLPGQEAGHALADVLLGRAEAAGRLPWTLPARAADVPVPDAVPVDGVVEYREGLHVGHRGWDRAGLAPAFPFGHGLGWTEWAYEAVTADADGAEVAVRVTNTGARAGREVVQVYLEAPQDGPDRPLRVLAGFASVTAEPGATVTATIRVPSRVYQVWDVAAGAWTTPAGAYRLHVGRSSRDLRLTAAVEIGTA
ncbi:beta-glucosidase [Streptomyces sp. NPDC049879]|uniref:beta-glucosidase n=1 Tax=Streptomyces sp. NPDC049879 TaxID=3365598 RepID=UPI0037BD0B5C